MLTLSGKSSHGLLTHVLVVLSAVLSSVADPKGWGYVRVMLSFDLN